MFQVELIAAVGMGATTVEVIWRISFSQWVTVRRSLLNPFSQNSKDRTIGRWCRRYLGIGYICADSLESLVQKPQ